MNTAPAASPSVLRAPGVPTDTMPPDLDAIKGRQRAMWGTGDYAVIGTTLQIVGETLCEAADVRGGQRVLDVAAGNGNASLAAARRWADVVASDYVPALLARARARATAEGLPLRVQEADAEQLPFADASFDTVLSVFGVMFVPRQERAAAELLRVCRPGGTIALANWTPDGFIGRLFKLIGQYVPPAPGLRSPALWGTREHVDALFGARASAIAATRRDFTFRYRSSAHFIEIFRTYYGPVHKAFAALDVDRQAALERDMLALLADCNRSGDETLVAPSTYLEAVITKR
jgi:SAM-dependent methyltransferase